MRDYLKEVEDQLVELTERGAHRRPRPRLDRLALAAAVVVVAAVAVAVSTIGGSAPPRHAAGSHGVSSTARHRSKAHHARSKASPRVASPNSPPGGPVPAGFGP